MSLARSINIFLHDGDPEGIRTAQIMLSTIHLIAFRKLKFKQVRDFYPELRRAGVYILLGYDEAAPDQILVYIGESECVGDRLQTHINQNKKTFWSDTMVVVSKDENLTKSHARYVEARLIADAGQNARWKLLNDQKGSEEGKLPYPDRVVMDEFIAQTKTLVGALGYDIFKVVSGDLLGNLNSGTNPEMLSGGVFNLSGNGFDATMQVTADGEFVVGKGSRARLQPKGVIPRTAGLLRDNLKGSGLLVEKDGYLEFVKDYLFTSTSTAAAVVAGYSVSGPNAWKLPDGTSYKAWENGKLADQTTNGDFAEQDGESGSH